LTKRTAKDTHEISENLFSTNSSLQDMNAESIKIYKESDRKKKKKKKEKWTEEEDIKPRFKETITTSLVCACMHCQGRGDT
jgi:hypothetical protein